MVCKYEIEQEAQEKLLAFLVRMLDNGTPGVNGQGTIEGVPAYWLEKPKENEA